ncbi:MAG: glycoside hydrolase family 92 protein [Phaeodactylibacter sp.]|nr:glycoside hydrolase family 92 protein [Phaeodactylibacter sp.]
MHKFPLFLALLLLIGKTGHSQSVLDYVNLFICTAGDHGQLDPSATVPFGMVKLGPETEPGNHGGYDYNAQKIKGFSHSRVPGVGCRGAGGSVLLKPGIGEPTDAAVGIDKEREEASPGYYRVYLPDAQIDCELTANNYAGFHCYTFPKSEAAYILVDLEHAYANLIGSDYQIEGLRELAGWVKAGNVCKKGAYTQYFHLEFSKEVKEYTVLKNKIYAFFETKADEVITVQVGLSPISSEQAQKDKENSLADQSFDQVREEAAVAWQNLLGRVELEGKEEYKTLFYTHLYHSCLMPVNTTSTDGQFKGADGEIYRAQGYTHYNGWSVWDTYRTQFPLLILLYPDKMQDFTRSIADLFFYGQGMVGWSGKNESAPTVRKEHSLLVLLDAYRKGVAGIDFEKLWPEILADVPYLPYASPDDILETSYDYWAISEVAGILGKTADQEKYRKLAHNYKHIWKKKFSVMDERSDIMHGDGLYEGTLWQYRWSVPWDIEGLIGLMGGKEPFTTQLEQFFDEDLYNHGNQPGLQAPFLFNFSNKPWRTQELVNKILTRDMTQAYGTHEKWKQPYYGRIYKAEPEGYIPEMDDDAGTMSAWYVLASMGLYPVCVGLPEYQLSAPLFDKITIRQPNGKKIIIKSKKRTDDNFYIQAVKVNSKKAEALSITHDQLAKGGRLTFYLSNTHQLY